MSFLRLDGAHAKMLRCFPALYLLTGNQGCNFLRSFRCMMRVRFWGLDG